MLLDVLSHQHDVAFGVFDEVGVATAHEFSDLRFEAFSADTAVQRNQHLGRDGAALLMNAGIHEKGGSISAKMLIPLHGRVG